MSLTPNAYLGLWEGPIDNKASSVINAVFKKKSAAPGNEIEIGDTLYITEPLSSGLLPAVDFITTTPESLLFYGIAIGGDLGGIYPSAGTGFKNGEIPGEFADLATKSGEGIRVCTQGRCVSRMSPIRREINIGDALSVAIGSAALQSADSGELVVARALQFVAQKDPPNAASFAAVDIQREGKL